MKAMSKQQLADAAGVSVKVLIRLFEPKATATENAPQESSTFALSRVTRRTGPGKDSPLSEKPATFLPERYYLSPRNQPPFSASITL
jgi:hypothetical protein